MDSEPLRMDRSRSGFIESPTDASGVTPDVVRATPDEVRATPDEPGASRIDPEWLSMQSGSLGMESERRWMGKKPGASGSAPPGRQATSQNQEPGRELQEAEA